MKTIKWIISLPQGKRFLASTFVVIFSLSTVVIFLFKKVDDLNDKIFTLQSSYKSELVDCQQRISELTEVYKNDLIELYKDLYDKSVNNKKRIDTLSTISNKLVDDKKNNIKRLKSQIR